MRAEDCGNGPVPFGQAREQLTRGWQQAPIITRQGGLTREPSQRAPACRRPGAIHSALFSNTRIRYNTAYLVCRRPHLIRQG